MLFVIYSFRYRKTYMPVRCLNDLMRLLSQVSREYKGNKYKKFWIIIPSKIIEKLGWRTGQELKAEVKDNKMLIHCYIKAVKIHAFKISKKTELLQMLLMNF